MKRLVHGAPSGAAIVAIAVLLASRPLAAQTIQRRDARTLSGTITEAVTAAVDESIREVTKAVDDALRDLPKDLDFEVAVAARGRRQVTARPSSRADSIEKQTRTLNLGPAGMIDLSTSTGSITVTAGSGPATVEAVRRVAARGPSGPARPTDSFYSIEEHQGTIRLRAHEGMDVSFNLVVPAGTEVHARTVNGAISITGVRGDIDARAGNGTLTLANVASVSMARSFNGPVTISDVETTSDVTVGATSGSVSLTRVKARRLTVDVVEGIVAATDVAVRQASISSSVGAVLYRGPLARGGHYDIKTHSGSVRFDPTGTVGFEVEAQTYSGSIDIDTALKVRLTGSPGSSRRTLTGTSGDGDAVVNIVTFSGTVTIGKS